MIALDAGKKILEEKLALDTRENLIEYISYFKPEMIVRSSSSHGSTLDDSDVDNLMGKDSETRTPANNAILKGLINGDIQVQGSAEELLGIEMEDTEDSEDELIDGEDED